MSLHSDIHRALEAIRQLLVCKQQFIDSHETTWKALDQVIDQAVGPGRIIRVPENLAAAGRWMAVTGAKLVLSDDWREVRVEMTGPLLADSGRVTKDNGFVAAILAALDGGEDRYLLYNQHIFDFTAHELDRVSWALSTAYMCSSSRAKAESDLIRMVEMYEQTLLGAVNYRVGGRVYLDGREMRLLTMALVLTMHTVDSWGKPETVIELGCKADAAFIARDGSAIPLEEPLSWPAATMRVATGVIEECDDVEVLS